MGVYLPFVDDVFAAYAAANDFKAMLVQSTFVDDPDDHFRSAITADEIAATGYTAGGVAVTGVAFAYDSAEDQVQMTFDPVEFGSIVPSTDLVGIVVYVDNGSSATDVLIGADVFGDTEVEDVTNFIYEHGAAGFVVAQRGEI